MSQFMSFKAKWMGFALAGLVVGSHLGASSALAVTPTQLPPASLTASAASAASAASSAATASSSSELSATPSSDVLSSASAELTQKAQVKADQDITETSGKQKDQLVAYLESHPAQQLSWHNFLAHAIRAAIKAGVPANVLVLVLLFPLIASIIAASRHIIGLRGFGIYIPAVLAVALVSTGPIVGITVFVAIISMALFSKKLLRFLNLSYLPRTALLLWLVSLAILGVLLLPPSLNLINLTNLNIFPILILVLLSENFLDAQASTKPADALALAVETLALAFVSGLALKWPTLQHFALIQPELLIIVTAIFNILIGKFAGLRLTEWFRFRPIIEE